LKDSAYDIWWLLVELISSGVVLISSQLSQIEWWQVVANWRFVEFGPRYETGKKGGGP